MTNNKNFEHIFKEYLTVDNGYCGNSIIKDTTDKIYGIDLCKFSTWKKEVILTGDQAEYIRAFIREKIDNGTLYTPIELQTYSLAKRFQLFINSNIAEHTIVYILNGQLLDGNDLLTIQSTAVIGNDGCALADVIIDGIEVEVKVTHTDETKVDVFKKAHKKPVVAVYTITPDSTTHWEFYIRSNLGHYSTVNFVVGHNYKNIETGEVYDADIVNKAIEWQANMRIKAPKLSLLHFKDLEDGSLKITEMKQKNN